MKLVYCLLLLSLPFSALAQSPSSGPSKVNLQDLNVQELKAMAYDRLAMVEKMNQEMRLINEVIAQKAQAQAKPAEAAPVVATTDEKPKKDK